MAQRSVWLPLAVGAAVVAAAHVGPVAASHAARPDLTVRSLTPTQRTAAPGGQLRARHVVANLGRRKAGASRLGFYLSGDARRDRGDTRLRPRRRVRPLAPRRSTRGSTVLEVPAGTAQGPHRLLACADDRRRVRERRERNNCRAARGSVTIRSTPLVESEPATLLASGDIASCVNDNDEATAQLVDGRPGTVATLGDNVYENGTTAEFANCYEPTWGRARARTRPSAGNREYNNPGAAGYFGYFGAAAGNPGEGYYSYDLGDWHVIVLNTSDGCDVISCSAGSAQVRWLQADLAANPRTCTLAYWHHPLFTSYEPTRTQAVKPFWDALYAAGADVVLSGHAHNYERFAPQSPTGQADAVNGIREFVVGVGGRSFHQITGPPAANSEVRNANTFGILRLTLRASDYSWEFVPVAGGSFTDAGTGSCH